MSTELSEIWDLENLARARRLGDWMFSQFADLVRGRVVEVGAGIGTFSERLLDAGIDDLLLIEPEAGCAAHLATRFAGRDGVDVVSDPVPGCPALQGRAGSIDFVLCQNVLEHVEDHRGAVAEIPAARPRPIDARGGAGGRADLSVQRARGGRLAGEEHAARSGAGSRVAACLRAAAAAVSVDGGDPPAAIRAQ